MKKLIFVVMLLSAALALCVDLRAQENKAPKEESVFYTQYEDDSVPIITMSPPTRFTFSDAGYIDWSSGSLKFYGNIDKSAKIFFEYFWRVYVEQGNGGILKTGG